MILLGQYDSPFVRRVAISLHVLDVPFVRDMRSVFGDFDAVQKINPLGRIPALVLDDGDVLVDSAAILDWLDQSVGPERALIPPHGPARRRALQTIALAAGAIEKIGAAVYERLIRPSVYRWPEWIERCRAQGAGAIRALSTEPWLEGERLDQAQITTACLIQYVRMTDPGVLPPGRYPMLDALSLRLEAQPEFQRTCPSEYAVPRGA